MINLASCTLIETYTADVHSEAGIIEEGTALVFVLENGTSKVKPSTGAANEDFAGVSIDSPSVPSIVPLVESFVVPATAPYTKVLSKPINGTDIRVTNLSDNRSAIGSGNPASTAGKYSISGNTLTFNAAQAGQRVEIAYRYAITMQEAIYKYNFDAYSAIGKANIGRTGLCSTGIMYTSKFDIAADWASAGGAVKVTLKSNGEFSLGGSGTPIDALVREVPSNTNNGMLALRIGQQHSL